MPRNFHYLTQAMIIPDDFILGTGDSDLQVIGERSCIDIDGAAATIWSAFSASGKVFNNHSTDRGIDRHGRYAEDAEILAGLGVRHYRTSVSMSRILREDLSVNQKSVDWYKRYFDAVRAHGIELHVTLYHWELPQFVQDQGGWFSGAAADAFMRHAESVVETLGSYISQYYILNEPWVIGFIGNFLGIHAPGNSDMSVALRSIHNLLLAQGRAARMLKSAAPSARTGTVYNIIPPYSIDSDRANLEARQLADCYFNRWFLDPLYLGRYPEESLRRWHKHFPEPPAAEMEIIKAGELLDTFGINYYGGSLVKSKPEDILGFETAGRQFGIKNDMGWAVFAPPVYPRGLYDLLITLHNRYQTSGMNRIIITENGTAVKLGRLPGGGIDTNDDYRIFFIHNHLDQIMQALQAGVPVEGYFLWTLMDNFEWAEGYKPEACFGLVHVDQESLKRTPLKSYYWYRDLVKSRKLLPPFQKFS